MCTASEDNRRSSTVLKPVGAFALVPVSAVFYVACIVCLIYHIDFIRLLRYVPRHFGQMCCTAVQLSVARLYGCRLFSCRRDRLSARAAFRFLPDTVDNM